MISFSNLDINFNSSIVNEAGASIYSVTKEAKDEFGTMDPNLISASMSLLNIFHRMILIYFISYHDILYKVGHDHIQDIFKFL